MKVQKECPANQKMDASFCAPPSARTLAAGNPVAFFSSVRSTPCFTVENRGPTAKPTKFGLFQQSPHRLNPGLLVRRRQISSIPEQGPSSAVHKMEALLQGAPVMNLHARNKQPLTQVVGRTEFSPGFRSMLRQFICKDFRGIVSTGNCGNDGSILALSSHLSGYLVHNSICNVLKISNGGSVSTWRHDWYSGSLNYAVEKAKLLLEHCAESSKLFSAIKGKSSLSRCERIRDTLEVSLRQIQDMVPQPLASQISEVVCHLRTARFTLDSSCSHILSTESFMSEDLLQLMSSWNENECHLYASFTKLTVMKHLQDVHARSDVNGLKIGPHILLAFVTNTRELPSPHDDVFKLVAEFRLIPGKSSEAIQILQNFTGDQCVYKYIVTSGMLHSSVKILDMLKGKALECAIKIFGNLFMNNEIRFDIILSGCITKIIQYWIDGKAACNCMKILQNLCDISEDTIAAAVDTEGCLSAVVELLDNSTQNAQEYVVTLFFCLYSCGQEYCHLVMKEGIRIFSVPGHNHAKDVALKLLLLLPDTDFGDASEELTLFLNSLMISATLAGECDLLSDQLDQEENEERVEFKTDDNQVLHGLDRTALPMPEGALALVTIAPAHDFGLTESKPELPVVLSNVTVYYEVDLVSRVQERDSWDLNHAPSSCVALVVASITSFGITHDFTASEQKVEETWASFFCVALGLWAGLLLGFVPAYVNSTDYSPVQDIADSCGIGVATNVIFGLALGYKSPFLPILAIAASIYVSFSITALYGTAVAIVGVLSTIATSLFIDDYGPISDNARGHC